MQVPFIETETLKKVLEDLHYGEESQDPSLTEILNLMSKFPNFVFSDTIDFSMKDLFIQKYDVMHICTDDIELFLHFWREKTNDLLMKYAPKMQKWLDNFDDLFKFTVKLEKDENEQSVNGNTNTYYLNPANANTSNLKVQDVDKSDGTHAVMFHQERDVLQSVWGKTRADIMAKILDLRNIFNDCLEEFSIIFIGVI